MVSIRDIAKQSGYSISTVSRYINKSGYVSQEAAETIAEATGSTIIQVIGHTIVLYKEARNPKHRDLSVRFAEFKKRGR